MRSIEKVILACAMTAGITVAQAHHSYAMFDTTRKETVSGAVRTLEWASPHVWLWVEVADGKGGSVPYGFETVSPAQLERDYGWKKNVLKAGDKVTVEFAPLRSGKNGGELEKVTMADGRVLATRFSKGAPAPATTTDAEPKK